MTFALLSQGSMTTVFKDGLTLGEEDEDEVAVLVTEEEALDDAEDTIFPRDETLVQNKNLIAEEGMKVFLGSWAPFVTLGFGSLVIASSLHSIHSVM